MSQTIEQFQVRVQVIDDALLIRSAQSHNHDIDVSEIGTPEEALRLLCVNPDQAPCDSGYELLNGTSVHHLDSDEYLVCVQARINNHDKLIEVARTAYGDQQWEPECYAEALYEVLLASNSNAAPLQLGFEIIQFTTEHNDMTRPSPAP